MSEQVQLDRYDGTGSSLWPVMRRLDQTAKMLPRPSIASAASPWVLREKVLARHSTR